MVYGNPPDRPQLSGARAHHDRARGFDVVGRLGAATDRGVAREGHERVGVEWAGGELHRAGMPRVRRLEE